MARIQTGAAVAAISGSLLGTVFLKNGVAREKAFPVQSALSLLSPRAQKTRHIFAVLNTTWKAGTVLSVDQRRVWLRTEIHTTDALGNAITVTGKNAFLKTNAPMMDYQNIFTPVFLDPPTDFTPSSFFASSIDLNATDGTISINGGDVTNTDFYFVIDTCKIKRSHHHFKSLLKRCTVYAPGTNPTAATIFTDVQNFLGDRSLDANLWRICFRLKGVTNNGVESIFLMDAVPHL